MDTQYGQPRPLKTPLAVVLHTVTSFPCGYSPAVKRIKLLVRILNYEPIQKFGNALNFWVLCVYPIGGWRESEVCLWALSLGPKPIKNSA